MSFPTNEHVQAFEKFIADNPLGALTTCRVLTLQPYGCYCELAPDVSGLLLVPYFAGDGPKNFPDDYPEIGASIQAKIEFVNPEAKAIRLSQK